MHRGVLCSLLGQPLGALVAQLLGRNTFGVGSVAMELLHRCVCRERSSHCSTAAVFISAACRFRVSSARAMCAAALDFVSSQPCHRGAQVHGLSCLWDENG